MAAAILVSLGLSAEASAQASGDFVEDVSFTRGKWGEPLDYQDGDDSEAVWLVAVVDGAPRQSLLRSEEHTSELQSLMRISYAVFCLKKKKLINTTHT